MDLQLQFILQNVHFALNLFVAFVFFAAFWLFIDAWTEKKDKKDALKWIGFLFISLSFLANSTQVEQIYLVNQFALSGLLTTVFRIAGYGLLGLGLLVDPLQKKPKYKEATLVNSVLATPFLGRFNILLFLPAVLAGIVSYLFYRRVITGLEEHLKPVALSFTIFTLAEILSLGFIFRQSTNVSISAFTSSFGALWIMEQVILFIASLILAKWVFNYLLKRLQTQLFMIVTTIVIGVFLVTTITFTMLLLQNLRMDALSHLQTDASVLYYAIESKKSQILSDVQVIAQNQAVVNAIKARDKASLKVLSSNVLIAKKQGTLAIVSATGVVLARGEDPERIGDSMSDDILVKHALRGEDIVSSEMQDGVLAPQIIIRGATPIKDGSQIIGVVISGSPIDNAFVDGIKNTTNLDASVYAGNVRSATTFVASDGKSRLIGIKEKTPIINSTVLGEGKPYAGAISILNVPFFEVYLPLKDSDGVPVGMLSVGSLQLGLFQAAGRSIELTFLVTVALIILSILPAFYVSRYIAYQFS